MLIGTSFTFLLLCLPAEINDITNYTNHKPSCFPWFRKVILMLMQQIYYAGHFYIYTLTGQIFRKHLYAIVFKPHHENYINRVKTTTLHRSKRIKHERIKTQRYFLNSK
jgi:hypothetical protein